MARALGLYMWDQDAVREREAVSMSGYGFNRGTAPVGLLSELLFRVDTDGWVFERLVTERLENAGAETGLRQLVVSGLACGERFDPMRR